MTILTNAAAVLRCYGELTELTVTDVAARLGLPKSNASRLLRGMREAGLLETVGTTKRHRPGLLLLDVARAWRRSSSLVDRADAVVQRISAATGHTGYVSMRLGTEVTAITDHPGTNALRVASTIGRRLPAFASATGRTLLARLSDAEVASLHREGIAPPTPNAPQDLADLLKHLATVRRQGYDASQDEVNAGVAALAVAVADPESGEDASLCIAFPSTITAEPERQAILRALLEGAAEIAAITGDGTARRRIA